jgi:hypothetical protein
MQDYNGESHPDAPRLDALLRRGDAAITAYLDTLDDATAKQLTRDLAARAMMQGIEAIRGVVEEALGILRDEGLPALEQLRATEYANVEGLFRDVSNAAGDALYRAGYLLGAAGNHVVELFNDFSGRREWLRRLTDAAEGTA